MTTKNDFRNRLRSKLGKKDEEKDAKSYDTGSFRSKLRATLQEKSQESAPSVPSVVASTVAEEPQKDTRTAVKKALEVISKKAKETGKNVKDLPTGLKIAATAPFMNDEQFAKMVEKNPQILEEDYAKRISGTFFDVATLPFGGAEAKAAITAAKTAGKEGIKQGVKQLVKKVATRGVEGAAFGGARSASQGNDAKTIATDTGVGLGVGAGIGALEKPAAKLISKLIPKKGAKKSVEEIVEEVTHPQLTKPELTDAVRTIKKIHPDYEVKDVEYKPITDVDPNFENGLVNDPEQVERLKEGFANGEPIKPVIVIRNEKGETKIIDGRHRYQAATESGIKEIPVVEVKSPQAKEFESRPKMTAEDFVASKEAKLRAKAPKPEEPKTPFEKTLMVVHNIREPNYNKAKEIGGLANPSVAIIDSKKGQFDNYGEITLVGDKDLPFSGRGKTAGSDIYSPTFPSTITDIKDFKTIENRLSKYEDITSDKVYNIDSNDIVGSLKDSPLTMADFFESKGIKIPSGDGSRSTMRYQMRDIIHEKGLDDEYSNHVMNIIKDAGGEEKLYNGRTYSGKRKTMPLSAENASKIMNRDELRSGANNFNYGLGSVRAKVSPEFKTVAQIKKNQGKIVSEEEFLELKKAYEEIHYDILDELKKYDAYPDSNPFVQTDQISQNLMDYLAGDRSYFNSRFKNVPKKLLDRIDEFSESLKEMPTQYFETKFKRVVQPGEFKYALVPDNASPETIKKMERDGLKIVTYKADDAADRAAKLSTLEDVKFRLKDDLAKKGIEITDAQEQDIIALNEHMFGDADVKITGQILANKEALGKYENGIIEILGGQADAKETFYHEAVHKYLDVFTDKAEHAEILKIAQQRYGIDDFAEVEEQLAEDFINYARSREGVTGPMKIYFDKILNRLKAFMGNKDDINTLYNDILSGKAKRERTPEQLIADANLESAAQKTDENVTALKDVEPEKSLAEKAREALEYHVETQRQQYEAAKNTYDLANERLDGELESLRAIINREEKRGTGFDATKLGGIVSEDGKTTTAFDIYADMLREATGNYDLSVNDVVEYIQTIPTISDINKLKPVVLTQKPDGKFVNRVEPKKVAQPIKPVGIGPERRSKLFQRVKGDLVDFSDEATEDPTYRVAHDEDQINKAIDIVSKDYEGAIKALRGERAMPAVLPNALYSTVVNEALERGDFELAGEMSRRMSMSSTAKGQDVSFLRNVGKDTPLGAMAEVSKARIKAKGGKDKVNAMIKETAEQIKTEVAKTKPKHDWGAFVESLRCT